MSQVVSVPKDLLEESSVNTNLFPEIETLPPAISVVVEDEKGLFTKNEKSVSFNQDMNTNDAEQEEEEEETDTANRTSSSISPSKSTCKKNLKKEEQGYRVYLWRLLAVLLIVAILFVVIRIILHFVCQSTTLSSSSRQSQSPPTFNNCFAN